MDLLLGAWLNNLDSYKDFYFFELSRKIELWRASTIPLTALTVFGTIIGFLITYGTGEQPINLFTSAILFALLYATHAYIKATMALYRVLDTRGYSYFGPLNMYLEDGVNETDAIKSLAELTEKNLHKNEDREQNLRESIEHLTRVFYRLGWCLALYLIDLTRIAVVGN